MRLLLFVSFFAVLLGCTNPGTVICNPGTSACGAGCADFTSDRRNCGVCGQACLQGQICSNSACVCETGSVACNGICAVLENDPLNCGACGMACAQGFVCENKMCKQGCTFGDTTNCAGSCAALATDPHNCGLCGAACEDKQSCRGGACTWDVIAACFTSGQIVGISDQLADRGPLQAIGSHPASLASYSSVLLVLDGTDDRLNQASLPNLTPLASYNQTGDGPTQVVSDPPWVYSVNSTGGTLQILGPMGDAGCPPVGVADAGCAFATLDDGGVVEPLAVDGGCFVPASTDGGCADTLLPDGGDGPLQFADGGCFAIPPAMVPFNFCAQGDAGLVLTTLGELNFGVDTFPEAVVKVNGFLWVPLHGGIGAASAAGQKVIQVDISDVTNPHAVGTVDFSGFDLFAFDAGTPSVAGPYAITTLGGQLYVALNNLNPFVLPEVPGGPGIIAVVDPGTRNAQIINLGADICQNVVSVTAGAGVVYVTCAGAAVYDSNNVVVANAHAGVVAYDPAASAVRASWAASCPADAGVLADGGSGCIQILPGRVAVFGTDVLVADQSGGRVFVLDAADGGLTQKGQPIQACAYDPVTGFANVADILSLP